MSAGTPPTTTVSLADDDAAPVIVTSSPLEATDADDVVADLEWKIAGGADAGKFTLAADGELAFTAEQDYEAPGDADTDGDYGVTVRVTDGHNPVAAAFTVRLLDVDEIAPTLASAAVDGDVLTLSWDEALNESSVPAASVFAVTVESAPRGVDGVAVAGSAVTLTLTAAVTANDTVTVTYAVPTDPAAARIEDAAGNDAAGFTDQAVTKRDSGRPDLVVTSPRVSDIGPAGAQFTLSATVSNHGEGAAEATTLRYYRSTDAAITTSDTSVGTVAIARACRIGEQQLAPEALAKRSPSEPVWRLRYTRVISCSHSNS